MATLTYHGHATCSIETDDGTKLVIDPFFNDNPACDVTVDEVEADFILVTHGHGDHIGDLLPLARRTGAQVISTYEIVSWLGTHGIENAHPLHIGGGNTFPFGYAKMTPALHGGKVDGPGAEGFTTVPGGFLINFNSGQRFHHAGDTALLMEMQLLAGRVDIALLPIGDNFTMGPEDAVRAVEFIKPKVVIPIHYNTWPPIAQDPEAFKAAVGDLAQVEVVPPGSTYVF
jgi:L-ascorbate metabolism protein UlaG (beta-lactamase superfamily)